MTTTLGLSAIPRKLGEHKTEIAAVSSREFAVIGPEITGGEPIGGDFTDVCDVRFALETAEIIFPRGQKIAFTSPAIRNPAVKEALLRIVYGNDYDRVNAMGLLTKRYVRPDGATIQPIGGFLRIVVPGAVEPILIADSPVQRKAITELAWGASASAAFAAAQVAPKKEPEAPVALKAVPKVSLQDQHDLQLHAAELQVKRNVAAAAARFRKIGASEPGRQQLCADVIDEVEAIFPALIGQFCNEHGVFVTEAIAEQVQVLSQKRRMLRGAMNDLHRLAQVKQEFLQLLGLLPNYTDQVRERRGRLATLLGYLPDPPAADSDEAAGDGAPHAGMAVA